MTHLKDISNGETVQEVKARIAARLVLAQQVLFLLTIENDRARIINIVLVRDSCKSSHLSVRSQSIDTIDFALPS